jgi:hypothetical protein
MGKFFVEHPRWWEVNAGGDLELFFRIEHPRIMIQLVSGQAFSIIDKEGVFEIHPPACREGYIGVEPGGFSTNVKVVIIVKKAVMFFIGFIPPFAAGKTEI